MITIEDFKKVEIRAGKILSAEAIAGSEKLLKLSVDFGPASAEGFGGTKQVVSGIAKHVTPEKIIGNTYAFVTNLEPRKMMGLESQAMIVAFSGEIEEGGEGFFSLLEIPNNIPPGTLAK